MAELPLQRIFFWPQVKKINESINQSIDKSVNFQDEKNIGGKTIVEVLDQ
jgi:hypothetical protein